MRVDLGRFVLSTCFGLAVSGMLLGQEVPAPPEAGAKEFKIDPKTPAKDLLPIPPKSKKIVGPILNDDLSQVPEVEFQATTKGLPTEAEIQQIKQTIAKINHLDARTPDGFVKALRSARPDLARLPFVLGNACRTNSEKTQLLAAAVQEIRGSLPVGTTAGVSPQDSYLYWLQYPEFWNNRENVIGLQMDQDRLSMKRARSASVAALMQIVAPEPVEMRLGLVKHLAGIAHTEATRALARLAIFSNETEIHRAALDALKVRRERDYTDILLIGLHYPWPAVNRHSAEAIAQLERTDLIPELIRVLEKPDPRAPAMKLVGKKKSPVVRELVRINHHKSCLLCHAPVKPDETQETFTATIPLIGDSLPPPGAGYGSSDQAVRVDVTYLRQDFSLMQPVADAAPWPEMQRFDFLVRSRVLTRDEAAAYREKLTPRSPGSLSPYHRAALFALRELTGKDTEPKAEAWRKLLRLPARHRRVGTP